MVQQQSENRGRAERRKKKRMSNDLEKIGRESLNKMVGEERSTVAVYILIAKIQVVPLKMMMIPRLVFWR